MKACDELLDRLESAGPAELPAELAAHAQVCDDCRQAVARAQGLEEGGHAVRGLRAPAELVNRIKGMRRLPLACESALELTSAALDGDLGPAGREELVNHMHGCESCQAFWEAMATLQEVGRLTPVGARLRARLAIHPRRRVDVRRRGSIFDLRLATAAAYLIAAMTVVLVGNPASIARASSAGVEKAQLYTRAAVENRLESLTRRARTAVLSAQDWLTDTASAAWDQARGLVRRPAANPPAASDVSTGRDEGKRP
jgi:hypothetical protein